jgi:hypothetical protein
LKLGDPFLNIILLINESSKFFGFLSSMFLKQVPNSLERIVLLDVVDVDY